MSVPYAVLVVLLGGSSSSSMQLEACKSAMWQTNSCCLCCNLLQAEVDALLMEGANDASTADLPMDTKPVVEEAKQVGIVNSAVLIFPCVQPAHNFMKPVLHTADLAGWHMAMPASFHNSALSTLAAYSCSAGCSAQNITCTQCVCLQHCTLEAYACSAQLVPACRVSLVTRLHPQ